MSVDTFTIKKGDRREAIDRVLKGSNGLAVDLSSASGVKFVMKETKSGVIEVNATAAVIAPATDGHVRYSWAGADTDTPGTYDAEWQVTFNDGTMQRFPNDGYLVVYVMGNVA